MIKWNMQYRLNICYYTIRTALKDYRKVGSVCHMRQRYVHYRDLTTRLDELNVYLKARWPNTK